MGGAIAVFRINQSGVMAAGGRLRASSAVLNNTLGTIAVFSGASDALVIHASAISNRQGVIDSAGALTIASTGAIDNTGSVITAAAITTLRHAAIDNTGGEIAAGSLLDIDTADTTLNNTGGSLLSGGDIVIAAGDVHNRPVHHRRHGER